MPASASKGNSGVQSSANAAGANNLSIAAVAGKTAHVSGFTITGAGATSATIIAVSLSDGTWTLNYDLAVPAGATTAITPLQEVFTDALPASAANTAITLTVPSFGTGNAKAAATLVGFYV